MPPEKEKLLLKDIVPQFKQNVNRGTCIGYAYDLLDRSRYKFDYDVFLKSKGINLQRPLVWTESQKSEFILSILKEITIPPVTLISYNHEYFKVIDGKQRLNTMISFLEGKFPINIDGKNYYVNDMDDLALYRIQRFFVIANIYYEYPEKPFTDDELIRLFNIVNFLGTSQEAEHMERLKKSCSNLKF